MAGRSYSLVPRAVPKINTKYRRIVTSIPVPQSLPILKKLRKYEPVSMTGQAPVVWHRAEGVCVFDRWGNRWLDWSSGVLVTNAGHANAQIARAMKQQIDRKLLHNYCFPSEIRAALAERLVKLAPKGLDKAFILTTGAEATECAIKLARTHGRTVGGDRKIGILSFKHAFHGRTMGAQMAGGIPALKDWIVNLDPAFHVIEFPGDPRSTNTEFDSFERQLAERKLSSADLAGVITETYQGGGASFMPLPYAQALRRWCTASDVVLIFDEVQAGFGRCGKMFGFQHYGIVPDVACFGKGITSCMPLSAVLGRADLMDQYAPGSMTSTHTGNPVCAAAALASIDYIVKRKLPQNAAKMGTILHRELNRIRERFPKHILAVHGKGLVAGVHMVKAGTTEPDGDLAFRIVEKCMAKGLLMFSPVGFGGATVKIAPPLVVTQDAILEGVAVLQEAIEEAIAEL